MVIAMIRPTKKDWTVSVFRPNGHFLTKVSISCVRHDVAINRAKVRIYQQGRLAHFYTFVAIQKDQ